MISANHVCCDCGVVVSTSSSPRTGSHIFHHSRTTCFGHFSRTPTLPTLHCEKYKVPFYCLKCGAIKSPWRAIRDIAIIYPIPIKDTYKEQGKVVIPDQYKGFYKKGEGVLLSIGPGYYDDKKFHPVTNQLVPGALVRYNKDVMWAITETGVDGKEHVLTICGAQDIWFIQEE